jgi:hypothetical protein
MSEINIIEIVLWLSILWNIFSTLKILHVEKRMIGRDKIVVEIVADFLLPKFKGIKDQLGEVNTRIDKNQDNVKAILQGLYSYLKIRGEAQEDRSVIFKKK